MPCKKTEKKPCTINRRRGFYLTTPSPVGPINTGLIKWHSGPCGYLTARGACLSCRARKEGDLDRLSRKGKKQLAELEAREKQQKAP